MLFNSIAFLLFLPVVFGLYWFVFHKHLKLQNALIVVASYFFYGWWDWRFLSLITVSTLVDFVVGLRLQNETRERRRKQLLVASISVNLGMLGYFKYFNFFVDSFVDSFAALGLQLESRTLHVLLPVGISFYTFQTLSYTIDVYRRKLTPTNDLVAFAAFVSFFPQLVAGPIELPTHLLPKFYSKRLFCRADAANGLRQILWGFFKKAVIADNCAEYVNLIFNNADTHNGSALLLGAILFSFQIYGDFSGYSDIAIGTSRLFGFDLMQNFAYPYFARDIAEFWRRWHISLSTWFRDYLYIPLGGSRGSTWTRIRNTFAIFTVSGLWHGANWTFIVWGLLHALYFLPLLLLKRNRVYTKANPNTTNVATVRDTLRIAATFALTTLAWIVFRAETLQDAWQYLSGLCSSSIASFPSITIDHNLVSTLLLLGIFLVIEWSGRGAKFAIEKTKKPSPRFVRWSFYTVVLFLIGVFMQTEEIPFIYFQF